MRALAIAWRAVLVALVLSTLFAAIGRSAPHLLAAWDVVCGRPCLEAGVALGPLLELLVIALVVDLATSALAEVPISKAPSLMLLLLLPIALDCFVCLCIGGSWRNTLSGEAHYHREHPYFGGCERMIDALFFFQPGHCRIQAEREERFGSVWAAWAHDFNNGERA